MNTELKKADALWGRVMHAMYDRCAVCGSRDALQAHHLITRGHKSLRHHPEAGIVLCATHHEHDPEISPHAAPTSFKLWFEGTHPEQAEWLRRHQNELQRPNYQAAILHLTDVLACLQRGLGPVWRNGELYLE